MVSNDLTVLYTDNHLIAVFKPAGLLTQPDHSKGPSLLELTRQWIKEECDKPGNVFLGLVHRLDRPVAGVVLFARTSKAASRLSKQFREKTPVKIYRAFVRGTPKENQATLVHYLRKEKSLKATVFPHESSDAKRAELAYKVIKSIKKKSLVEVTLTTGRFHQIRAQLAFIGHPIVGDIKYASPDSLPGGGIALYAHQIVFDHPVSGEKITIISPEPQNWM
jgi:23S rRNA pseudouridine1911/1915/1917 synthase